MLEQLTIEFIAFSLVGILGVVALMFWGVIKRAVKSMFSTNNSTAKDQSSPDTSTPSISSMGSAISSTSNEVIEDESFFELAMSECSSESDQRHFATWSKAYSIAEGDENKAKAIYIKLRVEKLTQEERHRRLLEKANREKQEFEKKQKDYQEWINESNRSIGDSSIAQKAKAKISQKMWLLLFITSAILSFIIMSVASNDISDLTSIALLIFSLYSIIRCISQ